MNIIWYNSLPFPLTITYPPSSSLAILYSEFRGYGTSRSSGSKDDSSFYFNKPSISYISLKQLKAPVLCISEGPVLLISLPYHNKEKCI